MTFTQHTPAEVRILSRLVVQPNGCWHWTGVIDSAGYGRVGYNGRRGETLQRAVHELFIGPIPDGHEVDHGCHNDDATCVREGADCLHRRCGNPAHLRALPRLVNGQLGKQRIVTCPKGHAYDEDNTRVTGGRRFCKACNRAAKARLRARRKTAA